MLQKPTSCLRRSIPHVDLLLLMGVRILRVQVKEAEVNKTSEEKLLLMPGF